MLIDPQPDHRVWLDGELLRWDQARMPLTAHHYGVGVFEGVRLYPTDSGPAIFRLGAHTRRLFQSAHILDIRIPYGPEEIDRAQLQAVRENQLTSAYIRPFVYYDGIMGLSPSVADLTVHTAVLAIGWQDRAAGSPAKGLRVRTSSLIRNHASSVFLRAKANGNYMTSVMALKEARAAGADDALLLDGGGRVVEGTGANVFIVRDGTLLTPPLTAALPGITRDTVLTLARDLDVPARESQLTRDDLYIADEVFFTGTAAEIAPIVEVDGRAIANGEPGPLTTRFKNLYDEIIHGRSAPYREWLTFVE